VLPARHRQHRPLLLNWFRVRKQFSSGIVEGFNAREHVFELPYTESEFITLFALHDPDGNLVEVYYAGGM